MTSPKYICAREQDINGKFQVVVVNVDEPTSIKRIPVEVDNAMVSPSGSLLAIKVKN
jgi:hypothetical protein